METIDTTSCVTETAMSKRLRSLASFLWDSDVDAVATERNLCHQASQEMTLELATCRAEKQKLETELCRLKDLVKNLRDKDASTTLQLFEVQKFVVPLGGQPGPRTTPVTETSWIGDNKDLLSLPGMERFLQQLDTYPNRADISFNMCSQQNTTASRILKHGEWVVSRLMALPAVFKVGITENVLERWSGKAYSYKFDPYTQWDAMIVLFIGNDSLSCGLVESHLISRFWGRPGFRNCQPGGETAKPGPGPFFTYVVYKSLAAPPRWTWGSFFTQWYFVNDLPNGNIPLQVLYLDVFDGPCIYMICGPAELQCSQGCSAHGWLLCAVKGKVSMVLVSWGGCFTGLVMFFGIVRTMWIENPFRDATVKKTWLNDEIFQNCVQLYKSLRRNPSESVGIPLYTTKNQFIRRNPSDLKYWKNASEIMFFLQNRLLKQWCSHFLSERVRYCILDQRSCLYIPGPGNQRQHDLRQLALNRNDAGAFAPHAAGFVFETNLKNELNRFKRKKMGYCFQCCFGKLTTHGVIWNMPVFGLEEFWDEPVVKG